MSDIRGMTRELPILRTMMRLRASEEPGYRQDETGPVRPEDIRLALEVGATRAALRDGNIGADPVECFPALAGDVTGMWAAIGRGMSIASFPLSHRVRLGGRHAAPKFRRRRAHARWLASRCRWGTGR